MRAATILYRVDQAASIAAWVQQRLGREVSALVVSRAIPRRPPPLKVDPQMPPERLSCPEWPGFSTKSSLCFLLRLAGGGNRADSAVES
jgi:hypothetical protein